jgi:hypothetical protein
MSLNLTFKNTDMASISFRTVIVHVVTPSIISSDRTEFSHANGFPMFIKTSLSE